MLVLKLLSRNILIPSTDSGGDKTLRQKKPIVLYAIVLLSYFKYGIPTHIIVGKLKSLSITFTSQKNRPAALYATKSSTEFCDFINIIHF